MPLASAPQQGEVLVTLVDLIVAPWNSDGTYGDPVRLQYGQSLGFTVNTTTAQLMAYGMEVEALAVPTSISGSLSQGNIDIAAYAVLLNRNASSSGAEVTLSYDAGYNLPYFGVIGAVEGVDGGAWLGLYKAKLESVPSFTVNQNEFVIPETTVRAIANNTVDRRLAKLVTKADLGTLPDAAAAVDTFFGVA